MPKEVATRNLTLRYPGPPAFHAELSITGEDGHTVYLLTTPMVRLLVRQGVDILDRLAVPPEEKNKEPVKAP